MSEITTKISNGEVMENVIIKGDLSKLTPEERGVYYMKTCESVGLNPLTRPFEFITLNGKLTMYVKREATDQLRTLHNVSVESLDETEREGVFVVTAKVRNSKGRTDMAKGAVALQGLKGADLANALMKAETKAKRRATLSICGLGFMEESEIEDALTATHMVNISPADFDNSKMPSPFKNATLRNQFQKNTCDGFHAARSHNELTELMEISTPKFNEMKSSGDERDEMSLEEMRKQYQIAWKRLAIEDMPAYDEDEARASGLIPKMGV